MDEQTNNNAGVNDTSNIVEQLTEVLGDASDTLKQYQEVSTASNIPIHLDNFNQTPQTATEDIPLLQPEDENYEIFKTAYDQGNVDALTDIRINPNTTTTATRLLLRSPEFKDFIGRAAITNDNNQNISQLQNAIAGQRNYTETGQEGPGNFFSKGESYFLAQILDRLRDSPEVETFFKQIREQVSKDIFESAQQSFAELKEKESEKQPNIVEKGEGELGEDALILARQKYFERKNITEESFQQMPLDQAMALRKEVYESPEYKAAELETLGYNEGKHPNPVVRDYQAALKKWSQMGATQEGQDTRGPQPIKPKNYEKLVAEPRVQRAAQRKLKSQNIQQQTKQLQQTAQPQHNTVNRPVTVNEPTQEEETFTNYNTVEFEPHEYTIPSIKIETSSPEVVATSGLPSNEQLQNEIGIDPLQQKILNNTEATNILLTGLIKALPALVAGNGMSAPTTPTPAPTFQMPASQAESAKQNSTQDEGIPRIPAIRSQFLT